jgi:hypothetical protein
VPATPRPLGFLLDTLLFALLAASFAQVRRVKRCYRKLRGLCISCGYDLIGIPAAVCPECGAEHKP